MARHLFIVSRQSPDLFTYLAREFASEPDVTVLLDRRSNQRRSDEGQEPGASEPRQNDRRVHGDVGNQLSTLGYAFVRID